MMLSPNILAFIFTTISLHFLAVVGPKTLDLRDGKGPRRYMYHTPAQSQIGAYYLQLKGSKALKSPENRKIIVPYQMVKQKTKTFPTKGVSYKAEGEIENAVSPTFSVVGNPTPTPNDRFTDYFRWKAGTFPPELEKYTPQELEKYTPSGDRCVRLRGQTYFYDYKPNYKLEGVSLLCVAEPFEAVKTKGTGKDRYVVFKDTEKNKFIKAFVGNILVRAE